VGFIKQISPHMPSNNLLNESVYHFWCNRGATE